MLEQSSEDNCKNHRKPFMQSFSRRKTRAFSAEQKKIMDNVYPPIRLEEDLSNLENLSRGYKETYLEVGFGAGEHLIYLAESNPDKLIIGAEVFLNGVASCAQEMDKRGVNNIRFYDEDSRVLIKGLPESSIDKVYILFADPWPKKRHHKRRIINQETLELVHRILKENGSIRIATDHAEYFEWILEVCDNQSLFKVERIEQPEDHIVTRYQQKGANEGRPSQFLELIKNNRFTQL